MSGEEMTPREQQIANLQHKPDAIIRLRPGPHGYPVEVSVDEGKTWHGLAGVQEYHVHRDATMHRGGVEDVVLHLRHRFGEPDEPPF